MDSGQGTLGAGEMAVLIRDFDWTKTPLGARDKWPISLKTATQLVLASRFPMALLWGPELILIYNDAYKVICGGKHPAALGRSTREIWSEVWHINKPIFEAVMKKGETRYFEDMPFAINRHGFDENVYFTLSYSPVYMEDGHIGGTLVVLQETTGYKKAEEEMRRHRDHLEELVNIRSQALAESSEKLRLVVENIKDAVWLMDLSLNTIWISPSVTKARGYTLEEIQALPIESQLTHDSVRRIAGAIAEELTPTRLADPTVMISRTEDVEFLCKDGSVLWVECTYSVIRDAAGKPHSILGVGHDITERKKVEEAAQAAGVWYRAIYEGSPLAMVVWDIERRVVNWNRQAEMVFGWSSEEILGKDFFSFLLPASALPAVAGVVDALLAGNLPSRSINENLTKCGETILCEWNNSIQCDSQGKVIGVISLALDITKQKRDENALRLFKDSVEGSSDAIGMSTPEGKHYYQNKAFDELFGDIGENPPATLYVDHEVGREVFRTIMAGGQWTGEVQMNAKNRQILTVFLRAYASKDSTGRVSALVGVHTDITARRNAEEAVKVAETRYRSLFESMENGFALHEIILDEAGVPCDYRYLEANPAFERLTGLSVKDIVGRRIMEIAPETERHWIDTFGRVAMTGEVIHFENHWSLREAYYDVIAYCPAPGQFACVFTDITERKRDEEELTHYHYYLEELVKSRTRQIEDANKELESFTYSVSHDLKAPLRALSGFSRILLEDCAAQLDANGRHAVDVISSSAIRMGQLIEDLLRFSHLGRQKVATERTDMKAVAVSVCNDLKNGINDDRNVQMDIQVLPEAFVDSSMIRQVFENLVSNSIKFSRPIKNAHIVIGGESGEKENTYFVRDNGVGFDMQYAGKMFGVFQRLHGKAEFEGTGVGLAIVQRIVQKHGGRVWAEGKVGEGAMFYFSLPKGGDV